MKAMYKDTLQISAEYIVVALRLHGLKFRHKWRIGDQFCVLEDCEIFWQNYYSDRLYLVDEELNSLIEELSRQGVLLVEETDRMVFIPRLEDIVEFCAASVFTLDLTVELTPEKR